MSLLGLLGEYKAEPAATPPVYNITNSEEKKNASRMIRLRFMYGVVVNKISYCIYTTWILCVRPMVPHFLGVRQVNSTPYVWTAFSLLFNYWWNNSAAEVGLLGA